MPLRTRFSGKVIDKGKAKNEDECVKFQSARRQHSAFGKLQQVHENRQLIWQHHLGRRLRPGVNTGGEKVCILCRGGEVLHCGGTGSYRRISNIRIVTIIEYLIAS